MMYDQTSIRQHLLSAWARAKQGEPLGSLEQQIVSIINDHPEYHTLFNQPDKAMQAAYRTDNNPFLHIGLHLSLAEQIQTDRPAGIQARWERALAKTSDPHALQHRVMAIMADLLWQAQMEQRRINDTDYLEVLATILPI